MNLPPLKTEQWQEVSRLFHETLDQPSEVRQNWLSSQTRHDARVRQEVLSLLLSHEDSDGFLEKPVAPRTLSSLFETAAPIFAAGDVTGDFTIEKPLGAGSFGTVYLATQNSLGRKIALKVSPNLGEEAQTMAHLTHSNIVSVFSEEIHAKAHQRYICMQYVPGTNLEMLLEELPTENVTGRSFLQVIDRIGSGDGAFDPVALKDRETIGSLDGIETVLWLGARLAGALAYAHERGILHLDVKPGNILITPYGTPMLTDFNVASRRHLTPQKKCASLVGGTARYMPPEQKLLFDTPKNDREENPLDGRADIFALGKLLEESFQKVLGTDDLKGHSDIHFLVAKCTASERDHRFETAGKLAAALEGCLELRLIRAQLPERTPTLELLTRYPLATFLTFTLVPQVIGSFVNIAYNSLRIVNFLTPPQQNLFHWLVAAYNLAVYPACIALISAKLSGLMQYLRNPCLAAQPGAPSTTVIRARILDLPLWVVAGITLGWMPGSIFFPAAIHAGAGPISREVFGHFFISFTLSWLIALTYSFLLVQFILLRAYYPRFWFGSPNIRGTARRELAVLRPTLRIFPYMAGFVPLVGAALIVFMGPGPDNMAIFRFLIAGLIGLGMLGLCLALRASHLINQTIYALTGASLCKLGENKN